MESLKVRRSTEVLRLHRGQAAEVLSLAGVSLHRIKPSKNVTEDSSPSRGLPRPENPHTGTIVTERPEERWAADHTVTTTALQPAQQEVRPE